MEECVSLVKINLNTAVRLIFTPEKRQKSDLKSDIRREIAKAEGADGGPDFYVPFWGDAKLHAIGIADLHDAVVVRVESNPGRKRLYEALRDGFLLWWNERRRWTNEPFEPIVAPKATIALDGQTELKVQNLLAVRDAAGTAHYVYPYFSEHAPLIERGARFILWGLITAFGDVDPNELRVLDVLRGRTFSINRTPLSGQEEAEFQKLMNDLRIKRTKIAEDY
jgi:hypothetical protein